MSIRSTLLRRPITLGDVATRLQRDGTTAVSIGLRETDIPVGSLKRRVLEAVIVTDRVTFMVGREIYPNLLTRDQIMRGTELIPQRSNVLSKAIKVTDFLEGRGIKVSSINGVTPEQVRAELEGRAGHGKERC